MSNSIPQAFVHEFSSNVHHLGFQQESRVMKAARVKFSTADKFHWETLLNQPMAAKASRLAPTPVLNLEHAKRVAAVSPFSWGEALDHNDAARILIDPRSEYVKAAAQAYGVQIDTVLLTAATATAATGVGGGGAGVALPAGQQIGGTGGATGAGQKLTLAGLRRAKLLLDRAEVSKKRWFVTNAKGMQDLLQVTEVASADYNTVKALVQGEINTYMGFEFIQTEYIRVNTGNRYWNLAIAEGAMGLGIAQDRMVRVGEDPSVSFALRVYMEATMGAVRIEDKGVVALDVDETA